VISEITFKRTKPSFSKKTIDHFSLKTFMKSQVAIRKRHLLLQTFVHRATHYLYMYVSELSIVFLHNVIPQEIKILPVSVTMYCTVSTPSHPSYGPYLRLIVYYLTTTTLRRDAYNFIKKWRHTLFSTIKT
jgi:hypothetical protein